MHIIIEYIVIVKCSTLDIWTYSGVATLYNYDTLGL